MSLLLLSGMATVAALLGMVTQIRFALSPSWKQRLAKGAPYEVLVPDSRYVFVSSAEHIRDIDTAPDTVLSLQAAAKQILQPKYTMHNLDWLDKRGTEGTPLVKTLRTLFTNNITEILPDIRLAVSAIFDQTPDPYSAINGIKVLLVYAMVEEAVAYFNALAFFGWELAHDKEILKAAINFIESTVLIAELIRLLPGSIAP
ncbi:MAG: hypothetical protein Q9209_001254 [Squamulea sp. 1 TL-2023]